VQPTIQPGQKLNAACTASAGLVMLTPARSYWFGAFTRLAHWRPRDWFAFRIWLLVFGHVVFAVRDGDALEAMMVSGRVPAAWARRRAPRWYDEMRDSSR
jgi:formate dehydrogenase subunit gamma